MKTNITILDSDGNPIRESQRKSTLEKIITELPAEFVLINGNDFDKFVSPEDSILEYAQLVQSQANERFFRLLPSSNQTYRLKQLENKPKTNYQYILDKDSCNSIKSITVRTNKQTIYSFSLYQ